jgi:hypothetical protein
MKRFLSMSLLLVLAFGLCGFQRGVQVIVSPYPVVGGNTPALVGTQVTAGCGSSVATCAVTKSVTTAHLVIACTDGGNNLTAAGGGITDTQTLTWSDVAVDARTTVTFIRCWSATTTSTASDTFTAHFSPNTAFPDIWVIEVSGLVSNALDQVAHNNGNSASPSPGTTAAIVGGQTDFVWASCTTDASTTFTADTGGGYTSIAAITNSFFINENKNSSSGTQTTTMTRGSSGSWACIIAAFK